MLHSGVHFHINKVTNTTNTHQESTTNHDTVLFYTHNIILYIQTEQTALAPPNTPLYGDTDDEEGMHTLCNMSCICKSTDAGSVKLSSTEKQTSL